MPPTNRTSGAKRFWYRVYKARIRSRLERCRNCGLVSDVLTFGHLIPFAHGKALTFDNVTILCLPCNEMQGTEVWPELLSLQAEEIAAPFGRRWSKTPWDECFPEDSLPPEPAPGRTVGESRGLTHRLAIPR